MDVNASAVLPPAAGIIYLVDDDLSMLKALDRLLWSAGLQAQLFSEPLAFLSYVSYNSVALAVIDIWMSGMSGLQVQKKLQVVLPKTRVIVITATDEESVRNAAMQGGAIAYLVKPFDDDALSRRRASSHRRAELNMLKAMLASSEWNLDIGRAGIHRIMLPNYRQLHSEVGYRLGMYSSDQLASDIAL
jgi:FixJ family two-component response regulator